MAKRDDDLVGSLIHDVAHLLRRHMDEQLKPHGLTRAGWLALSLIRKRPGLTQTELAQLLELGTAATGKLVDRLEARGLVIRGDDPNDRRAYRLRLTLEAERQLDALAPLVDQIREDVLAGMPEEDRARLASLLGEIKARLQGRDPVIERRLAG